MSNWAAKRFWTDVAVVPEAQGYAVQLDGRPVKTPAKAALWLPSEALAQAVAAEWRMVEGQIDPTQMPFTQSANSAIDKVAVQFDAVAQMLAAYGGSDLLCYRADTPAALAARQAAAWDPLLDWAEQTYGGRLVLTAGVMPVAQSDDAVAALAAPLFQATAFELTGLHDLIALSGSLVIGLAVAKDRLTPAEGWALSRIDELWQAEQWGADDEAEAAAQIKSDAFSHAAAFYRMVNKAPHG